MRSLIPLALVSLLACAPAPPDQAAPTPNAEVAVTAETPAPPAVAETPATAPAPAPEVPAVSGLRDPFASPMRPVAGPVEGPPPPGPRESPGPKASPPTREATPFLVELTGIVLSPAGNRALVRVDSMSRILRVGDRVDGYRVLAIEPTRMILANGRRLVLRLREG